MRPNRAHTFRLDVDLDEALDKIAREERESLNQVANKAFRKYIEWDKAPTNRGLVSVPSMLLVKLMDDQTEQKAHALGRWAGRELFLPNIKAGYPTLSLERVERMVRMLGEYGGRFTFDHSTDNGKHIITVGQKMGKNWSCYYAGAMEAVFEDFLGKRFAETISDNVCVVEFKPREL